MNENSPLYPMAQGVKFALLALIATLAFLAAILAPDFVPGLL